MGRSFKDRDQFDGNRAKFRKGKFSNHSSKKENKNLHYYTGNRSNNHRIDYDDDFDFSDVTR